VQAACCAAWAHLIQVLAGPGAAAAREPPDQQVKRQQQGQDCESGGAAAAAASTSRPPMATQESDLLAAVQDTLCKPGFWRAVAGAKSAMVRRAAYNLARMAATRAPWILASCVTESAPCVLGAVGDKDPGNHSAMWEAVLTYGKVRLGLGAAMSVRMPVIRLGRSGLGYSVMRQRCEILCCNGLFLPAQWPLPSVAGVAKGQGWRMRHKAPARAPSCIIDVHCRINMALSWAWHCFHLAVCA
jgi:hypothetical protein